LTWKIVASAGKGRLATVLWAKLTERVIDARRSDARRVVVTLDGVV